MLTYCWLCPREQTSVKFKSIIKYIHWRKGIWKRRLWNVGHLASASIAPMDYRRPPDKLSITRATWMTVFHLVNIRNEHWCESSFPLSQFDISFIAMTTKIDRCIFSYLNYQNSSAFVEQAILIKGGGGGGGGKGTICERLSDSWSALQFSPHC